MSDEQSNRTRIPGWAAFFLRAQDRFMINAPGPRVLRISWVVNLHKIITIGIVYALMVHYDHFTTSAWIYLALHGSYGYCWLIKDLGFRDHQLHERISVLGGFMTYAMLIGWYWLIPWLFMSRHVEPSNPLLFGAIAFHTLGVVTMIAGDEQRHFQLKFKKGLITDGMFRYTRNPNYLGEIMIYSTYAWLANHWGAWLIVAFMVFTAFLPRMYGKDQSISRHPGWDEYAATSGMLIPWGLLNGRAIRDRFAITEDKG